MGKLKGVVRFMNMEQLSLFSFQSVVSKSKVTKKNAKRHRKDKNRKGARVPKIR